MPIEIRNVTFDCKDAHALAGFWSTLTGWNVYFDEDPEVLVSPTFPHTGTALLFIPVPEGKTAKNRVHLDIRPTEGTRDALVGDFRNDDGSGWVVLADPEGNEFCITRSAEETKTSGPLTLRFEVVD
jgi:hypothetical protein